MNKKNKNEEQNLGKIDLSAMRKLIDKKAGQKVSFNLRDENPADVSYWISTGSTWLDAIICRGKMAGLPGGRISEIAGLSSCVSEETEIEVIIEEHEEEESECE